MSGTNDMRLLISVYSRLPIPLDLNEGYDQLGKGTRNKVQAPPTRSSGRAQVRFNSQVRRNEAICTACGSIQIPVLEKQKNSCRCFLDYLLLRLAVFDV